MKHARTHANTRILSHPYQYIWAYRHSKVGADDLPVIAEALGISEDEIVDTACRLMAYDRPTPPRATDQGFRARARLV